MASPTDPANPAPPGRRGAEGPAELLIGTAMVSITAEEPVALSGQFYTRISTGVECPCLATAVALESREREAAAEQAVMVSCDLVAIREGIQEAVRERVGALAPDLDPRKVFLTATHTHAGPVTTEDKYDIPEEGVMQPAAYLEFLLERLAEVIARAWADRRPGTAGWALSHAAAGSCRRAVYADGSAVMYGPTDTPEFRGFEGGQDTDVDLLCFWDLGGELRAVAVNLACPSQIMEGAEVVHADFWGLVREDLQQRYGEGLCVLGWPGAAGDQSPHRQYYRAAEERMLRLRGLSWLEEVARRIVSAVAEAHDLARQEAQTGPVLRHIVEDMGLPRRKVTPEELEQMRATIRRLSEDKDIAPWHEGELLRQREELARQERGPEESDYPVEVHVLRLGEVALATNPFELFLDYGVQIKARSRAVQTFVIELTGGSGYYLPTQRAVRGGGYGAQPMSNKVGPEGGQELVDRTVAAINGLWPE